MQHPDFDENITIRANSTIEADFKSSKATLFLKRDEYLWHSWTPKGES